MTRKLSLDKEIDIEAILLELGQFGRYQKCVYTYLAVAVIFTAMYNCQYVFNAGSVEYRCRVPECESSPAKFQTNSWGKFALPASESSCYRMVPVGKNCAPSSFSNETQRCNSWIYENNLTIVPEFNLACNEWKRTLVGTIHNVGVFAALPITASISDAYGRRYALIGTSILPAFVGVVRGFCSNYVVYLVLEFFEALVGAGTYSTAFILALELVDLKKRVLGGNVMSCTYAVGQMVAATAAWAMPYWRTYTIFIFAPSILFIFYYLFVEESIRWLLVKGYKNEAIRIINKVAVMNKVKLMPATIKMLSSTPERKTNYTQTEQPIHGKTLEQTKPKKHLWHQIRKSRTIMFRLCVCSFWWVSVTMIYYGLSINSVSLMGGKYLNFLMTSVVEIPACLISVITLDRFGRKSSIMTSFFICGIALLILPLIKHQMLVVILTLVGKMMISLIFCAIYIYTIELFPTEARHMLMGFCSMTGRIGSMLAPQTPLLMLYMPYLPYLVFGGMAGIAGMLMLLTPETLHIKLPDTIAQAEQMNVATRTRKKTNILF